MRVFVFGSSGMLGSYVYKYLKSKGFDVLGVDRKFINAMHVNYADLDMLCSHGCDVFINCVGMIPQRGNVGHYEFISVNSAFPHLLDSYCRGHNIRLIHVTTDCVFDGYTGYYTEINKHTATDIYGRSKSFGEPSEATVIRTSIIGEEEHNKLSFLEWLKSQKGKTVIGYTDHYWNGVTCLSFAKLCEHIINENMYWCGVKHFHTPGRYTKYEMALIISDVYGLDLKVEPYETGKKCDRTLVTIRKDVTLPIVSNLQVQIKEQKDFNTIIIKDCL